MDVPFFIPIDEDGYFLEDAARLKDQSLGNALLSHLSKTEYGALTTTQNDRIAFIEAFDEPLIAQNFYPPNEPSSIWTASFNYGFKTQISLHKLCLDEWDRFHGYTENGIPYVMSPKAQDEFFNLLDGFTDDSIQYNKICIQIPSYWEPQEQVNDPTFWNKAYQENIKPDWDMGTPNPILIDMLPRLKLTKSRILVPGCGGGHDAARFAQDGHLVTAIDFSNEAIERARKNYGHLKNLKFEQADFFAFSHAHPNSFDLIFEHTLFCAINPTKRPHLIESWRRSLSEDGKLFAIFFIMDKRNGPPFGASEWEVRKRLIPHFQILMWARWRKSVPKRQGKELFVLTRRP